MNMFFRNIFLLIFSVTFLVNCADEYVPVNKTDMSPLYVESTVPSDGSVGVKRDLSPAGAIIINFSKAIDERYANENFINFTCNDVSVESKISLSEDKKVISIKLKSGLLLQERAECKVVISRLIRDSAGLPFYLNPSTVGSGLLKEDGGVQDILITDSGSVPADNNKDKRTGEGNYVFSFVTEYVPFLITNVSPANNEIISTDAIAEFAGVVIDFNKTLDPDTVNISNFIMSGEDVELLLSEDSKTVTIKPGMGLKEGVDYSVMIMPFVRDTSGNDLGHTYVYKLLFLKLYLYLYLMVQRMWIIRLIQ